MENINCLQTSLCIDSVYTTILVNRFKLQKYDINLGKFSDHKLIIMKKAAYKEALNVLEM